MLKKTLCSLLILSANCLFAGYADEVESMLTAMGKKWTKKEIIEDFDEDGKKEQLIDIAYGPADKGDDVDNWSWGVLVHIHTAPKADRTPAKELYTSTVKAVFPEKDKKPKVIHSDDKSIFASWFLHDNYSWVRFLDTDKSSIMLSFTVRDKKQANETGKILEPLMQKITFQD